MALTPLSAGFQSLPLLPTIKLGTSGAASQVGEFCVHSGTLWVSPTNSPVRLGVSPAAASAPTGVFNQWFEALFPCAGTLGCSVCHLVHQLLPQRPAAALPTPSTIHHLAGSASCRLAVSPLRPAACLCPFYRSG